MTSLVFWLIVWAVTAPVSYILVRRECRAALGKWTQADRLFWACFSLLCGPVTLAVLLIGGLAMKVADTPWAKREVRW